MNYWADTRLAAAPLEGLKPAWLPLSAAVFGLLFLPDFKMPVEAPPKPPA